MQHSYKGRKLKKRDFRALWIQRINAAVRMHGMSYSVFMGKLHSKNIVLNRKALAYLATNHAEAFAQIVKAVQ
jgi:large subunit ribosomal protein L20